MMDLNPTDATNCEVSTLLYINTPYNTLHNITIITHFFIFQVQTLLQQMQDNFQTMSDRIIGRNILFYNISVVQMVW